MQSYIDFANKNGILLLDKGKCQFCGANVSEGIKECIDIFNNELDFLLDFYNPENLIYKFLSVDAHTLQHPEIHGRWNNHFHLSRLHLIFKYDIKWSYKLSPKLSDYLNKYKVHKQDEYLIPPEILKRGNITTTDILETSTNETQCKVLIREWALDVYEKWSNYHGVVDKIAKGFLDRK